MVAQGCFIPVLLELAHGSAFGQWPVLMYVERSVYLWLLRHVLCQNLIFILLTRESEDLVTLNKGFFFG